MPKLKKIGLRRAQYNPERRRRVVCIGGGTGLSVVLSGLKKYPVNLSAIVVMFDNGGSGGKLRKELGILPLGDIRQCLVTLTDKTDFKSFFNYRFDRGTLKGHNLGNLLIAAVEQMTGSLEQALNIWGKILNVKGQIFPVTFGNANIKAILKNGKKISGEENIINCRYLSKVGVKKIVLEPKIKANPKATSAIKSADLIVICPGKFFTSILPNFVVNGIVRAIRQSRGQKVFVCNLMTQIGNTDNFRVEDFVGITEKYLGKGVNDFIIFNTGKLSSEATREVKKVFPGADSIKYDKGLLMRKGFIGEDLLDRRIHRLNPADVLVKGANKRTMVLHNPEKLAKILIKLCKPR